MELNLGQGRGTANARMTQSRKTPDKCMPDLINMAMISKIDNDDIEDPSQWQYVKDQHMHILRLNGSMYKPHVRYDFWFCRNGATNPIRYPNRPPSSPVPTMASSSTDAKGPNRRKKKGKKTLGPLLLP
ncbi:hypothetical protein J3E68DRAFT_393436 [Trichoderma sp. SZMC 28012]